jgi:hypothetical protein
MEIIGVFCLKNPSAIRQKLLGLRTSRTEIRPRPHISFKKNY